MKYIRQFVIILFISFIGEALKYVILFVSTIVVMGVSGKVTQTMIEAEERKKNEGHSE